MNCDMRKTIIFVFEIIWLPIKMYFNAVTCHDAMSYHLIFENRELFMDNFFSEFFHQFHLTIISSGIRIITVCV